MLIRGTEASVELSLVEVEPHRGDFCFSIAVSSNGFAGSNESVWIDRDEFLTFLQDARTLERTRRGTAVLNSMSPEVLKFELRTIDAAGHLAVFGQLGRWIVPQFQHSIQFGFDLNADFISQMVDELEEFASPRIRKA